jgi:putative ABC transport system substrate-binding protein
LSWHVAVSCDRARHVTTSTVTPLLQMTRTVPVVFVSTADPVGAGLVNSFTRPGGNATGFMAFEYSLSAKWLELLKRIMPDVARVAVLRDSSQGSGTNYFAVIQAMAPLLRVEVSPVNASDADDIQRAATAFARDGGLVVTPGPGARLHHNLIVKLAAQHRLAAVYPYRYFMAGGGLISYGPNQIDQYRKAAGYVDRILRGEKPADLPVQAETKYELIINLKTAKTLGLTIPETLLATADEVIQ